MGEPAFCDECDVSLDLHDGPDSCWSAEHKAALVARVFSIGPTEMFS